MFADMAKFTVVGLSCALYVVHIYERIVPFTGLAAKSHTDQEILDSWSSAQICRSKIRSYTHPQTGKRFGDTSWSLWISTSRSILSLIVPEQLNDFYGLWNENRWIHRNIAEVKVRPSIRVTEEKPTQEETGLPLKHNLVVSHVMTFADILTWLWSDQTKSERQPGTLWRLTLLDDNLIS